MSRDLRSVKSTESFMLWRLLSVLTMVFAFPVNAQDLPRLLVPNGQEQAFRAYVTGYSFWDNAPLQTSEISHPVIHELAGGVGTYTDPITIAVGYIKTPHDAFLDFPAGTRFYMPHLRKYAIVEDSCGEGAIPQNGPCHTGQDGLPWLEIYVDGIGLDQAEAEACSEKITNIQTLIMDPSPNHSVVVGELTQSGCYTYPDL